MSVSWRGQQGTGWQWRARRRTRALERERAACAQLPLGTKTVGMTALRYNNTLEYDAHNLYGLAETQITTAIVARLTGRRPFVLTRCAFVRGKGS